MKRTDGTGSISFDKTVNKIVARILINGKYKKKTFQKNELVEAEKWLHFMSIGHRSLNDITVGEWINKYIIEYKKPFLRTRSFIRIKQAAKKWEHLYNKNIDDLKPSDIQTVINQLKEKGLSASSIKKSHELLKSALSQAVAENLITKNPVSSVKLPLSKKHKIEIFSRRELGNIFLALRKLRNNKFNNSQTHDYVLFFRLLLTTGVRVSELLALSWENVDVSNHMIYINGSKDLDSQTINEPKTEAGIRAVPLLSVKTRNLLYKYKQKNGFVFKNKNGGAVSYNRIFLTWNNVRRLTGITKNIHAFRHTCLSYLLTYGNIPLAEVSQIAGHANPAITLQIYTHAIKIYTLKHGTVLGQTNKK